MILRYTVRKKFLGDYVVSYACPWCRASLESPLHEATTVQKCPKCNRDLVTPGAKELNDLHESIAKEKQRKAIEAAAEAEEKRQKKLAKSRLPLRAWRWPRSWQSSFPSWRYSRILMRHPFDRKWRGKHMHIDHIVPRIAGGTDDLDNLCAACIPCNLKKNAKSEESFLAALAAGGSLVMIDGLQPPDEDEE